MNWRVCTWTCKAGPLSYFVGVHRGGDASASVVWSVDAHCECASLHEGYVGTDDAKRIADEHAARVTPYVEWVTSVLALFGELLSTARDAQKAEAAE